MNHPVENRNNQRSTGGQKPVLVQVQTLPIAEHGYQLYIVNRVYRFRFHEAQL